MGSGFFFSSIISPARPSASLQPVARAAGREGSSRIDFTDISACLERMIAEFEVDFFRVFHLAELLSTRLGIHPRWRRNHVNVEGTLNMSSVASARGDAAGSHALSLIFI